MSTTADTPPLVVRRTLGAPLALVYRAWSEPGLAARWSWGAEHETLSVELDCRPGGVWKQVIRNRTNGEQWSFDGMFQEVEPLRRLVHTFHWRGDRGQDEGPSLVTIEFFERPAGTEVVITHRQLDSAKVDGTRTGWEGVLVAVESCVAESVAPSDATR
jgi:uncharacterized protein YndB with AHSA1/START domain